MAKKKTSILTQEEILEILSGKVPPEEMIKRWEDEAEKEAADEIATKKPEKP